jgi:hypothetical protein
MSDDSRTAQPESSIHVNHWCCIDGCGQWGGFGFARTRAEKPRWWCWEHYPHKPNKTHQEAVDIAESLGTATSLHS